MFAMPLKASITGEVDAIAWLCCGGVTFPSAIFLEGKSASSLTDKHRFQFPPSVRGRKIAKRKNRN
jgi:hypothetical protein